MKSIIINPHFLIDSESNYEINLLFSIQIIFKLLWPNQNAIIGMFYHKVGKHFTENLIIYLSHIVSVGVNLT